MTNHTATRLGAVAAATLGSLVLAGTAAAESTTFHDAHGDMSGHGADIYKVRVVNQKVVRLRVQHDDLVRSYKSGAGVKVFLDTDRAERGPEFVFTGGLFEGTDYALHATKGWKLTGNPVTKPHVMRLRYAKDITRITFSRASLGRPDEVRVAVKTGGDLDGQQVVDWLDGHRELTPWVARG